MVRKISFHKGGRNLMESCILLMALISYVNSDSSAQSVHTFESLTESYADAVVNIEDVDSRRARLLSLLEEAEKLRQSNPTTEHIYLVARIKLGYSTIVGLLSVRRLLREIKDDLELALEMDETVLNGNAASMLGYLYVSLPGWPMSFGDHEKGLMWLQRAMEVDDSNLGNNYFYAFRYIAEEEYEAAHKQLLHAKSLENLNSPLPNLQALIMREVNDDLASLETRLSETNNR